VPLEFTFDGTYFDLADFFHELKRFVRVANQQLVVRGRLLTVDALSFDSSQSFPKIKASLKARIYLVPKNQGPTAGATPSGPSAPSGTTTASSSSRGGSSPTATVPANRGP
jgi:hypothetical protein